MGALSQAPALLRPRGTNSVTTLCPRIARQTYLSGPRSSTRPFSTTPRPFLHHTSHRRQQQERFGSRLRTALKNTKTQWYPIPAALGIGFLGGMQFYRTRAQAKEREEQEIREGKRPPKRRQKIRPDGPWQVQIMSTLPLKAMSRLWGKFNELDIPYYLRVPGFKLYSFIFGVNLDEVSEPDLHVYPNLAAFFYRTLKPGVRPLDPNPNALLSPADGRVLQFGQIQGGDIEQVKGMTYSIDALLGKNTPTPSIMSQGSSESHDAQRATTVPEEDETLQKEDEEFARVNGISYTLPGLISGGREANKGDQLDDQTVGPASPSTVSAVRADLALGEKPWYDLLSPDKRTSLYYCVIYLAPGDYHRFHSPANWVVERRRHFAGELFSVSPYLQRTLPGLFTLNERVVLLGRWRWGFFSYVPVGATNVGSIKINFDRELRTNSLTTDTAADRAAQEAADRGEPYGGFAEATYDDASPVLRGHALKRGEEMGGFQLGSTIVLVFEAPVADAEGQGEYPGAKRGFRWNVTNGQKVKMGQALGYVEE